MAALAGEIALQLDHDASAHQGISVHERQRHQDAKVDWGIGKSARRRNLWVVSGRFNFGLRQT